jgi:hypothetical protein
MPVMSATFRSSDMSFSFLGLSEVVVDEKGEVDSSFAMSFPSSKFVVWATADPKEEIPTVRKSESGTQIGRAPHSNHFNGCHSHVLVPDVAFLLTFSNTVQVTKERNQQGAKRPTS